MSQAVSLQPRDLLLLQGLFECRIMTLAHISDIYFEGKCEAAKKRVQKLKGAGYLGERPRRAYDPSVLFLTRKTLHLLRDEGFTAKYPPLSASAFEKRAQVSDLTIRHELGVMDVKAAFHRSIKEKPDLSIAEFGTWPLLYEFRADPSGSRREVIVRPDGFIRIHEKESDGGASEHTFFLEVDRSTETIETLMKKIACYIDFYRSGGFAVKNGATKERFREFPFRVLVVCKSVERRNGLAAAVMERKSPIRSQVQFCSKTDWGCPLGEMWLTPEQHSSQKLVKLLL